MKKRDLGILGLLVLVLALNLTSACIINNAEQLGIAFPEGKGVNMSALESFCGQDQCKIVSYTVGPQEYKEINFMLAYAKNEMILVARKTRENPASPEIESLSIKFLGKNPQSTELMPTALKLLSSNNITYGFSEEDLQAFSNVSRIGNLLYYKPAECGNSFVGTGYKSDEYYNGWLIAARNCMVQEFNKTCPLLSCDACPIDSALENLHLPTLPLVNSSLEVPPEPEPENTTDLVSGEVEKIQKQEEKEKFNYGLTIGILIGVIVVLFIVILIIVLPRIKKLVSK